jgi:hypothetical protein
MQRIRKAAEAGYWVSASASFACVLSLPVGLTLSDVIAPALGYRVLGESGILLHRGSRVEFPTLSESLLASSGSMPWLMFGLFYTIPPTVLCRIAMFALKTRV